MKKRIKYFTTIVLCGVLMMINIGIVNASELDNKKIIEKEIILNIDSNSIDITPFASVTYQRHNVDTFTDTVRGKTLQANVTLKVIIRVNESTGVISSYSGPYLNSNWIDVGAYEGYLIDVSTNATYSASRRTLHCTGKFKIYARAATGADEHVSKEFTISLDAG